MSEFAGDSGSGWRDPRVGAASPSDVCGRQQANSRSKQQQQLQQPKADSSLVRSSPIVSCDSPSSSNNDNSTSGGVKLSCISSVSGAGVVSGAGGSSSCSSSSASSGGSSRGGAGPGAGAGAGAGAGSGGSRVSPQLKASGAQQQQQFNQRPAASLLGQFSSTVGSSQALAGGQQTTGAASLNTGGVIGQPASPSEHYQQQYQQQQQQQQPPTSGTQRLGSIEILNENKQRQLQLKQQESFKQHLEQRQRLIKQELEKQRQDFTDSQLVAVNTEAPEFARMVTGAGAAPPTAATLISQQQQPVGASKRSSAGQITVNPFNEPARPPTLVGAAGGDPSTVSGKFGFLSALMDKGEEGGLDVAATAAVAPGGDKPAGAATTSRITMVDEVSAEELDHGDGGGESASGRARVESRYNRVAASGTCSYNYSGDEQDPRPFYQRDWPSLLQECRASRKLIILIVAIALLLDNMLLTSVVPIIPAYLYRLRIERQHRDLLATSAANKSSLMGGLSNGDAGPQLSPNLDLNFDGQVDEAELEAELQRRINQSLASADDRFSGSFFHPQVVKGRRFRNRKGQPARDDNDNINEDDNNDDDGDDDDGGADDDAGRAREGNGADNDDDDDGAAAGSRNNNEGKTSRAMASSRKGPKLGRLARAPRGRGHSGANGDNDDDDDDYEDVRDDEGDQDGNNNADLRSGSDATAGQRRGSVGPKNQLANEQRNRRPSAKNGSKSLPGGSGVIVSTTATDGPGQARATKTSDNDEIDNGGGGGSIDSNNNRADTNDDKDSDEDDNNDDNDDDDDEDSANSRKWAKLKSSLATVAKMSGNDSETLGGMCLSMVLDRPGYFQPSKRPGDSGFRRAASSAGPTARSQLNGGQDDFGDNNNNADTKRPAGRGPTSTSTSSTAAARRNTQKPKGGGGPRVGGRDRDRGGQMAEANLARRPEVNVVNGPRRQQARGGYNTAPRATSTTTQATTTSDDDDTLVISHQDIVDESFEVGVMFASKPIVQAIANPFVGAITNRVGFTLPMFLGFTIMFLSTLVFAFGTTYGTLFMARAIQGVGSACTSVAGMSMIADRFPDDAERGNAMAIALGGLALGVVIGPPFGGFMYEFFGKPSPFIVLAILALLDGLLQLLVLQPRISKSQDEGASLMTLIKDPYILVAAGAITFANTGIGILEPALPLWMMDTMQAKNWEQGVAFLPAALSYLFSTNLFGNLGLRIGRWRSAMLGLIIIGVSLLLIPFATRVDHLILPNGAIGFAIGMVDSTMMPMLGYLVDIRHTSVYGSVYAIGDVAFCASFVFGPALSGTLVELIGFEGLIITTALICFAFAPLLILLRNPPARQMDESQLQEKSSLRYVNYNQLDSPDEEAQLTGDLRSKPPASYVR